MSSSNRPDFLLLPSRSPQQALLSTCFVSTHKIVSIYTLGPTLYVERKRNTSSFIYKTHEEAEKALRMMIHAASHIVDNDSYWMDLPAACGGDIRTH
jgi:hypothetical protein